MSERRSEHRKTGSGSWLARMYREEIISLMRLQSHLSSAKQTRDAAVGREIHETTLLKSDPCRCLGNYSPAGKQPFLRGRRGWESEYVGEYMAGCNRRHCTRQ